MTYKGGTIEVHLPFSLKQLVKLKTRVFSSIFQQRRETSIFIRFLVSSGILSKNGCNTNVLFMYLFSLVYLHGQK